MKHYILSIVCLTFVFIARGQDAFMKRDLLVSGGVGVFNYRHSNYNLSERAGTSLPVFLSAEYAINSLISVGPFAGYRSMQYRYKDALLTTELGRDAFKSRFISGGVRGTVHFTKWLEDRTNKDLQSYNLDLYTSLLLGYEYNFLMQDEQFDVKAKSHPIAGLVVGARYYFNYRVAIFGEVGPGIYGLANIGLTTRF